MHRHPDGCPRLEWPRCILNHAIFVFFALAACASAEASSVSTVPTLRGSDVETVIHHKRKHQAARGKIEIHPAIPTEIHHKRKQHKTGKHHDRKHEFSTPDEFNTDTTDFQVTARQEPVQNEDTAPEIADGLEEDADATGERADEMVERTEKQSEQQRKDIAKLDKKKLNETHPVVRQVGGDAEKAANTTYEEADGFADGFVMEFVFSRVYIVLIISILMFALGYAAIQIFTRSSEEEAFFAKTAAEDERANGTNARSFANMLSYLSLDVDGGLDKIGDLFPYEDTKGQRLNRILTSFSRLAMIISNAVLIFYTTILNLEGVKQYYKGANMDMWPPYFKQYMDLAGENVSVVGVFQLAMVSVTELFGVSALTIMGTMNLIYFVVHRSKPNRLYDSFSALFYGFQTFYAIATFSCLKLIGLAHPSLIYRYFQEEMARPVFGFSRMSQIAQSTFFVTTRLLAVVLGMAAFGVKLMMTSVQLLLPNDPDWPTISSLWKWALIAQLLVHVMYAVNMEKVLLERMLSVVTTGQDSEAEFEEIVVRNVYVARIAQVIYQVYFEQGRYLAFVVVLMSFDDRDMQLLLLNEDEQLKEEKCRDVRSTIYGSPDSPPGSPARRTSDS
eukprot:gnl/TRDRNA2_/TRDRNA2_179302_c0_seq1.p1 gnl/TRDRNA2_/TRDRNA2_179302_c0~~gnl/TRDRNA2_/TRDRNA2_179302_c0_seq1.p1  ORF type:complete len:617 (+),score=108.81 gnl/TRDRNA2_/TRDRNA2_179302_c0_seq1:98-1948(+)